jgi:hypothetical protein
VSETLPNEHGATSNVRLSGLKTKAGCSTGSHSSQFDEACVGSWLPTFRYDILVTYFRARQPKENFTKLIFFSF